MKEIYEVYVSLDEECNYSENVVNAIFETLEDAEAFANYQALLDGQCYTVCKRNVNPAGSGKKYTEKMTGKVVRFVGDYNSLEEDSTAAILNICHTEIVDENINTPMIDVEQDTCVPAYYLFDITYKLTDKDNSFDDIKSSLVELIKNTITTNN